MSVQGSGPLPLIQLTEAEIQEERKEQGTLSCMICHGRRRPFSSHPKNGERRHIFHPDCISAYIGHRIGEGLPPICPLRCSLAIPNSRRRKICPIAQIARELFRPTITGAIAGGVVAFSSSTGPIPQAMVSAAIGALGGGLTNVLLQQIERVMDVEGQFEGRDRVRIGVCLLMICSVCCPTEGSTYIGGIPLNRPAVRGNPLPFVGGIIGAAGLRLGTIDPDNPHFQIRRLFQIVGASLLLSAVKVTGAASQFFAWATGS